MSCRLSQGADKWLSVRSRNFLLVGNASESQMRRAGRNLEEFRAAFGSLFPSIREQASVGTTVVVFKDDSSFRPYKPLYGGKPANVDGYFQGGTDVNFIALTADTRTPHVIYHELVHSFTRDATAMPLWVGEGFAEFYGVMEMASNGKELLLGRPMAEHALTLGRTSLLPLQMDCSRGLTLRVRVNNQSVELHTDMPSKIEFVSYLATVSDSVGCGPVKPDIPVAIVYRRTEDTRFLGEPLRVEFVERKTR